METVTGQWMSFLPTWFQTIAGESALITAISFYN